jgi:ATP-dependent Clp protease ATP-binding subunit ClpC
MFERFTERARQVVVVAQAEARGLGHDYIGTEHLLLGLLSESDGLAARVLAALDVEADDVRERVVETVGRGDAAPPSGQIPFTPRAKQALELALKESLTLGQKFIGTEHVLLGVIRVRDGIAARILLEADVDVEKVREEVLRMLRGARHQPPQWRRRRRRFRALAAARDEALEEGNYDLARKLLELEIEEREKEAGAADEPEAGAG